MIVRTYGRRNRFVDRSFSESSFNGGMEDSLSQDSPQDIYGLNFSSQDSTPWSFDSEFNDSDPFPLLPPPPPPPVTNSSRGAASGASRRSRKPPKNPNSSTSSKGKRSVSVFPTSTLMETQEFGEMMEHLDEVNFALDGLRAGQPVRIRRASMLSLLSTCASAQQRRLLRTQGMAKTIIDAILGLSIDDSPSTLAAAALFYVLASDGQDEHLLDSPSCVRFLLKLLNPSSLRKVEGKVPSIGSKLLALHRDPGTLRGLSKKLDSSSTAIILKVQEILMSCKELKLGNRNDDGAGRPELSPKWVALLTLEKACLSTVSLEDKKNRTQGLCRSPTKPASDKIAPTKDNSFPRLLKSSEFDTSGTVRRVGGNFKERLRELGGLDAIFDVIASCYSIMKGWLKDVSASSRGLKDDVAVECIVLLLKCLKIMENATFLSKDNQNHLLEMDAKSDSEGSPTSFVGLVLSAIKILSGLSLLQNTSCSIRDEKSNGFQDGILSRDSAATFCSMERPFQVKSSKESQKRQRLSTSQSELSESGSLITISSDNDVCSIVREDCSPTIPINGALRCSNVGISTCANGSMADTFGLNKRSHVSGDSKYERLEDSQDPFAFDEDDMEPSKWDLLSGKNSTSQTHQSIARDRERGNGYETKLVASNCDLITEGDNPFCEKDCSSLTEEENELLDDCLLTAVKVLMNLTNDNPIGCQQIAACGGLDTMATLIVGHFPLFDSFLSTDCQTMEDISFSQSSANVDYQNDKHLSDQELDFLVAILGLLVNLVEKDSRNRSRLAAATVPLPRLRGINGKSCHRDVISLLCSIFLANQGAGEADGEGRQLAWNDEDALLQGEREAEKMIIEAYAALLLAFLSTESIDAREAIANCLPNGNLEVLIPVLERFVAFHLTLNMISPETHAAVSEVIESCRGP